MGLLGALFAKQAPVHMAEPYTPTMDGMFSILEARRGRGKSFGMVRWGFDVTRQVLLDARYKPDSLAAKNFDYYHWLSNYWINRELLSYYFCMHGCFSSLDDARDWVYSRVLYLGTPDTGNIRSQLTLLDRMMSYYYSLLHLDEINRMANAKIRTKDDFNPILHDFAQQSRKHSLTMLGATQFSDWVKSEFLQLFDMLWRAKVVRHKTERGPDGMRRPVRFNYYGSDPFGNGAGAALVRRAERKASFDFDVRYARLYNTKEPIIKIPQESAFSTFRQMSLWMLEAGLRPHLPGELGEGLRRVRTPEDFKFWLGESHHALAAGGPPAPLHGRHASGAVKKPNQDELNCAV